MESDELAETTRKLSEAGYRVVPGPGPSVVMGSGTPPPPVTTEKQKRRYRLLLVLTMYFVGLLTGFQMGMER